VHIVKEINVVLRAMRHLESADRRDLTVERVAALIDKSPAEVRHILSLNEHIASLDAPLEIDPNLTMAESIADDGNGDPESLLQSSEIGSLLDDWLAQLSERQRLVIERRYGLNGVDVETLDVIANDLGLTRGKSPANPDRRAGPAEEDNQAWQHHAGFCSLSAPLISHFPPPRGA
jgi:RNA polymerase nonessential primary-like sigma factor